MYNFLAYLLQPSTVIFLICLALLGHARFRGTPLPRTRRWWAASLLLFYVYMTPAAGYFASRSLERPFPMRKVDASDCTAIVILSGYAYYDELLPDGPILGCDTIRRCLRGDELAREYSELPVVVTGGKLDPDSDGPALATIMKSLLLRLGMPESRIVEESTSTNTHQNAANTRELLAADQRRIVLVTDATHMLRAKLAFEKAGFEVVPAPTGYAALGQGWSIYAFLPDAHAAVEVNAAAHEWIGLLWYKLRGWA